MPMVVPGRARRCSAASDQRAPSATIDVQPVHMDDVVDLRLGGWRHAQACDLRLLLPVVERRRRRLRIERMVHLVVDREGIDLGQRGRRLSHIELAGHDIGYEARSVFAEAD